MDNVDAVRDAVRATALGKAKVKGATARPSVGRHDFDFLARIKGHINVAEDYQRAPTVSIPLKATMALFVRYCGVTRDAAMAALERAMKEALQAEEDAILKSEDRILNVIGEEKVVDDCMARVMKLARDLPLANVKGPITMKSDVILTAAVDS